MDSIKRGTFVVSYCDLCKKKLWPPYEYCSFCYRRTSMVNVGRVGRIIEFTRSWLENTEMMVALIDMDGVVLLGSITEYLDITIGSKVILADCGIGPDGKLYFSFKQLHGFSSYTWGDNVSEIGYELR